MFANAEAYLSPFLDFIYLILHLTHPYIYFDNLASGEYIEVSNISIKEIYKYCLTLKK